MLIADPGTPTRWLQAVQGPFTHQAQRAVTGALDVTFETRPVQILPNDALDVSTMGSVDAEHSRADAVLVLTEVPHHYEGDLVVSEIFPARRTAVISYPTLGPWATKRRIQSILMDALEYLLPDHLESHRERSARRWHRGRTADGEDSYRLFAPPVVGAPRTMLGMARANDPWGTAPKLSRALAAASAAGAFGIFYNSIWQMAAALSTFRLLGVGAIAIVGMVAWLILSNRLWDKPSTRHLARGVMLYNGSTIISLLISVTILYLALVVVILFGSVVVIDPDFMSEIVGTEVSFTNYLDVAWLSAAMGVAAGAIGSTFDSRLDVRRLTHGQREHDRHHPT